MLLWILEKNKKSESIFLTIVKLWDKKKISRKLLTNSGLARTICLYHNMFSYFAAWVYSFCPNDFKIRERKCWTYLKKVRFKTLIIDLVI